MLGMRGKKILNFSTIAISFTVLMLVFVAVTPSVFAVHCTTTVTATSSIQTAVDAASSGDVVCLDDSSGAFAQQVVFDSTDSGITLTAAHGSSPVLDGTSLSGSTTISAIELLGGVSGVTIEGLEIKNYEGDSSGNDRSSGIIAASGTTSNILIKNNHIHDNFWNGVLVFSAGDFVHDSWVVQKNTVNANEFVNIELTNCNSCTIMKNDIDGSSSLFGVVVQNRNTIPSSGLTAMDGVHVMHNTIDGTTLYGIYVLSFTGNSGTFAPITGASTLLTSVNVQHNQITDSGSSAAIRYFAFNSESTAENARISHNTIDCLSGDPGIRSTQSGGDGGGTVKNVKVIRNSIDSDCDPIVDEGEGTKIKLLP